MLSPSDYGRPRTAFQKGGGASESYYGGFFNTQSKFDKQIENQEIRNSMIMTPKDHLRESFDAHAIT